MKKVSSITFAKKIPQVKSTSLTELKQFMDYCTDIHDWNEKREIAKDYFTHETISLLDASGFVNEAIKPRDFNALNEVI